MPHRYFFIRIALLVFLVHPTPALGIESDAERSAPYRTAAAPKELDDQCHSAASTTQQIRDTRVTFDPRKGQTSNLATRDKDDKSKSKFACLCGLFSSCLRSKKLPQENNQVTPRALIAPTATKSSAEITTAMNGEKQDIQARCAELQDREEQREARRLQRIKGSTPGRGPVSPIVAPTVRSSILTGPTLTMPRVDMAKYRT